jgi:hypothetical protein
MLKQVSLLFFVLAVLVLPLRALTVSAQEEDPCASMEGETVTISHAYLYIEYNYTDGDLGVHGNFDDHGWSELCVYDPNGTLILHTLPAAQLGDLTMAGIFFESREPELDEFDFEDLIATFPEGEYAVRGMNIDGTVLTGFATFSHDAPLPPTIVQPAELGEDDEGGRDVVLSTDDFVVEWEPVTESVLGNPVEILGYEVIITADDYVAEHGFNQPIYDVHVPADRTSLSVPAEFWEPNTLYEIEILALEASGNQTISLGFFTTQ